jgi:nucleoside-diphosphate-sugar epimerase
VIPALLRKINEVKSVIQILWKCGAQEAHFGSFYMSMIWQVYAKVGFKGELRFDANKPDGTPRKLMDVTKLRELGWVSRIDLSLGLNMV